MSRTIQTIGMIGFFICLIIMYLTPWGIRGIREYDSSFQFPDMKFHYSWEQITQILERIGSGGRSLYLKYLLLDTIFVFCFAILMMTITHLLFSGAVHNIFIVICILRGLFDLLENSFLIAVLKNYPGSSRQLITVCSCFTSFKFIMLFIWMIAVVLQIALLTFFVS